MIKMDDPCWYEYANESEIPESERVHHYEVPCGICKKTVHVYVRGEGVVNGVYCESCVEHFTKHKIRDWMDFPADKIRRIPCVRCGKEIIVWVEADVKISIPCSDCYKDLTDSVRAFEREHDRSFHY